MLDELERPSLYLSIGTDSLNFENYARSANFEGEKQQLLAVFLTK